MCEACGVLGQKRQNPFIKIQPNSGKGYYWNNATNP